MVRRKPPKAAEAIAIPDAALCVCGHPAARHWRGGGGHPELCLHGEINPTDPCTCRGLELAAAAA